MIILEKVGLVEGLLRKLGTEANVNESILKIFNFRLVSLGIKEIFHVVEHCT